MNKSIMMGRLVRDPEIRYAQTKNGEMAIANFRLAVDRKFVKDDGEKTDFFSCSAFGRIAEFAEKYLFQGIKVVITGRMENDNYKNRDGEQVYGVRLMVEDIEFAESKKAAEERVEREDQERGSRQAGRKSGTGSTARSGRSASSSDRYPENERRQGASRCADRDAADDYAEDYGDGRDSGKSSRNRNSGSRNSRSAQSPRSSQPRGRSVDDEYMDMDAAEEELDFD